MFKDAVTFLTTWLVLSVPAGMLVGRYLAACNRRAYATAVITQEKIIVLPRR